MESFDDADDEVDVIAGKTVAFTGSAVAGFDGANVGADVFTGRTAASVGPVMVGIDEVDFVIDSSGIDLVGEVVPVSGDCNRSTNGFRFGDPSAPLVFGFCF